MPSGLPDKPVCSSPAAQPIPAIVRYTDLSPSAKRRQTPIRMSEYGLLPAVIHTDSSSRPRTSRPQSGARTRKRAETTGRNAPIDGSKSTVYMDKDTKNATDCKFFIAAMQDFAYEGIYYITKAGVSDWKEGICRSKAWNAVGYTKKIEVIREGIRFRTSTVLKS